jgi:hypothetical protein
MDVKMPDGTVIKNVPEGVTKSQLMARYSKTQGAPTVEPEEDPGTYDSQISRAFNPVGGISTAVPPLTPEEGKAALGLIGSTVGSLVAPELAVPSLISKVKMLGPALSFFTKNAAKVGGAGVGGATGEAVADASQGQEVTPGEFAQDAAQYGGSELIGSGVAKAVGKALSPVADKITPEILKLLKFSQKENIPISAGALVPGMTEKIVRGGTDNFIPSRLVNQHYRGKMITRMNDLMQSLPENVGEVLGKEESSLLTTEAFRSASNAKLAKAKTLRTEFLDTIGPSAVVPVKNTESLLKSISSQIKDPALREFVEIELASISKGTKSAESLEQTLNQISSVRAKGADKKYLTQIRQAVQDDFKAVGADMEKLSNANNFFAMNSELLSSPVAKRLMKENLTSQQMTAQIFRAGNESFIKQLRKELPPETFDSLRAQNLANLFENFSETTDKVPGARVLTKGDQLVKWIENNKTVLNSTYEKETVEALENFAQLAKASKSDTSQVGKDIGVFGSTLNIGAVAGLGHAEPATLIFTTPALMGVAKSMMNPDGWIKKWLTTGLGDGATAGEAAKLGMKASVADE